MAIRELFVTRLYEAALAEGGQTASLNADLVAACAMLAEEDRAGRAWCKANAYPGYTSYASLDDLPTRDPAFAALVKRLDRHVASFAAELAFDLGPRGKLKLDSLWASVLRGGAHAALRQPGRLLSGGLWAFGGLRDAD